MGYYYRSLKLNHVYFNTTSLHFNLLGRDLYVILLTSYCLMNIDVVVIMTEIRGIGIGLDLLLKDDLEEDRRTSLDPNLIQDLHLNQKVMFKLLL